MSTTAPALSMSIHLQPGDLLHFSLYFIDFFFHYLCKMIAKFSSPIADVDPDSNYFNEIFTSVDGAIQTDYYTIDNFNSKFSRSCADFFFIVNANIRSFSKNIDNLLND